MKKALIFFLTFILFFIPVLAKEKKVVFDGQAAWSYIKDLSSDAMQGRKSGQPGGQMAAQYIVSKLKEWGLEPAAPLNSYLQDLTIEYTNIEKGVALEIIDGKARREFYYDQDWRSLRYSGSGNFVADIVFVGYGISAPQKEYDDYAGVDLKGKLALFSTDTPRSLEEKLKEEAQFDKRIKAAQEHGACGVLTFRSVESQGFGMFFGRRERPKKDIYKPDFVIISLENQVVDFIFKHQKTEFRYLFQQIETTSKPQSFNTGVRSFVDLNVSFDERRPTQNVLAKISGADKNLKNEYVMVGAHMDHLGIDTTGDVFNGADDNASGTAVVMEVARTMKLNQIKPKRTIIFALWAAEESGLLGSKYYTENPVYPLEKTVTCINLDMEGHGSGKVNFSGVYYAPEIWDILKARLPKELVDNILPSRGGPGGSDHTYFLSRGVPAFYVETEGYHFKTNRVGDVIDLIKPEVLKKAGDFVEAAVEVLASEPRVPILAQRQENYYWKYQTVVNFKTPPLDEIIEEHKDIKDPDVDFQLATVSEKEGLTGDALRIEMMKNLLAGLDKIRESKGLVLYGAGGGAGPMMMMFGRQGGNTTVLIGLRGISSFRDDLRWADVFAKQGIAFVLLENPAFLFSEKGLSEEGKKIIGALNRINLLVVVKDLESGQAKVLLENYKKPVLLIEKNLLDKDVMDLIKKNSSALGLFLGKDEDASSYFKKLDEAKKVIGAENLAIINERCLWEKGGKDQMLEVISEILKTKYEPEEISNLFSGTFLRVLSKARPEESSRPIAFRPF
jgi:hypothetical protein